MKWNKPGKSNSENRELFYLRKNKQGGNFLPPYSLGDIELFVVIVLIGSCPRLLSCIFRCVCVCVDSVYRRRHGVTGHFVPLSHPPSKVTKCCILSRDPYDNTVCAAFEQQVNVLSLWALNSWTIHPSQASFWTKKRVCLSHNWITNAA